MTKNFYPFDQKVVLVTGGGSGMGRRAGTSLI